MWIRTKDRSIWEYRCGHRFCVEMHCFDNDDGYYLFCTVEWELLDMTHLIDATDVRMWIQDCWQRHLSTLSYHETMEYIEMGLITETD